MPGRRSELVRVGFLLLAGWCFAVVAGSTTTAEAGYTHYFTWNVEPDADPQKLKECIKAMKQVLDEHKDLVAGPDGKGDPQVNESDLLFNGQGERNVCEPFYFPGKKGFNFCKTMWKPYDPVVVACLFVARDHFSTTELEIASDGEEDPQAFVEGRAMFRKTFGRDPPELFAGRRGMPTDDEDDPVHTQAPVAPGGNLAVGLVAMAFIAIVVVFLYQRNHPWSR